MRRLLLLLMTWCFGMPLAQAQTATDLNEGVHVTADATTSAQVLTWWGKADRTYFVQQSYDLIHWAYVPVVRSGAGAVDGLNFTCTDTRQFWRLKYTDMSTGVLSAEEADFDGDGLSNLAEVTGGTDYGKTDPFLMDSDNDGVSDKQEIDEGTDPTSASSNSTTILGLRLLTPLENAP